MPEQHRNQDGITEEAKADLFRQIDEPPPGKPRMVELGWSQEELDEIDAFFLDQLAKEEAERSPNTPE